MGSLPIGGAKRKGQRVPTWQGGTDETTVRVRLSPSAGGGKTVLTGPSGSWPNRDSFSGGRSGAGCAQQHRGEPESALGCLQFSQAHIC